MLEQEVFFILQLEVKMDNQCLLTGNKIKSLVVHKATNSKLDLYTLYEVVLTHTDPNTSERFGFIETLSKVDKYY